MKHKIQLSDHFEYRRLIRFTMPSILMMIFTAFFTALNDGLTSALISFLRSLLFESAFVMILPLIWSLDGIWYSIVVAEFMAVVVTLLFLVFKHKKFGYW